MSRKRELDQAHQPIEESRAALAAYDIGITCIVDRLRFRRDAALEFLNIMEAHAEPLAYEASVASWRNETQNQYILQSCDPFVAEAVLDSKLRKDSAVGALALVAYCKKFCNGRYSGWIERQLPALYRAIARESEFGKALASLADELERRDARDGNQCTHCLKTDDDDDESDKAYIKRIYDALCAEPVWLALRAEFDRRDARKFLRIECDE